MVDLVGRLYQNARKLKALETKRVSDPRHFSASESGKCRREIFLSKSNIPSESKEDAISVLRLEDGHVHGRAVLDIVSRLPGIQVTDAERDEIIFGDLPGYPPFIITGHCDFIIHDLETGTRLVTEVKGINRFSFKTLINEDLESLKRAYPKAIPQARIYRFMHDTDGSIVLVKCKDTSEYKQVTIPKDEKAEWRAIKKFAEIAKNLQEGNTPPCDYLKKDKRGQYCPFKSMCGR